MAQCPEIGYDRASQNPRYVANGWDTAVSCNQPSITLIPDYTVTAMTLNGQYRVDTIPYNPPDTTFHATTGVGGGQIPATMDDGWHTPMPLPFPFNFFGTNYRHVVVGGNGIISFDTTVSGDNCVNNYAAQCPIPNPMFPHKNAIYGVYEDIDPNATRNLPDALSAHRGIFQSIYDDYPCRKLCVSYNGMQQFSMPGNYCTYQIVCYESTNIIEVHVKKRSQGSATNNGCGLIGIQNAAGTAAFVAKPSTAPIYGFNPFDSTATIEEEAFRFTPLGDTLINFTWYRGQEVNEANRIRSGVGEGGDPGNDTLVLKKDTLNQGGNHCGPHVEVDSRLDVRNITTSQYITCRLRFVSAGVNEAGDPIIYDMVYTYYIGVDKDDEMTLSTSDRLMDNNEGSSVTVSIPEDASSDIKSITWSFTDGSYNPETEQRVRNAIRPRGNTGVDSTSRVMILQPYQWSDATKMVDTVIVIANVTFENGCTNYDTVHLIYENEIIEDLIYSDYTKTKVIGCSPNATNVVIPPTVTTIGYEAFKNCTKLTAVEIPSSVALIDMRAFEGCSNLASVVIPSSVDSIPMYAFYGCSSLTSVTIPTSVTSIGYNAFEGCSSLATVNIPNSVTCIWADAFKGCISLATVNIPSSVTTIGWNAFEGCSSLTSIDIPSSVTRIEGYTFSGCSSLTSVNIPSSVSSIEWYAFSGCSSLTTVEIPSSVTTIGNYAFFGCSSLTSVNIPISVITIEASAFYNVRHIVYYGRATGAPWGARSMNGYVEDYLVYTDTTKTTVIGCLPEATAVVIPASVVTIDKKAFYQCSNLTTVTFDSNSSLISIGNYAFYYCSNLATVEIPSSVTTIGNSTFRGCSSLTTVEIPSSVTTIESSTFRGCSSLTTVEIPSSVTTIGNYAFRGCSSLDTVIIKSSCDLPYNLFGSSSDTITPVDYLEIHSDTPLNVVNGSSVAMHMYGIAADAYIYVPCAALNNYRNHTVWSDYPNYRGFRMEVEEIQEVCDAFSWIDGNTYTKDTMVTYALPNNICDSVVTLNLSVNSSQSTALQTTLCQGESYAEYGFALNNVQANDTVERLLATINGCDSTVSLALTVKPVYRHTDAVAVCNNMFPYQYGDTALHAMGVHTIDFATTAGCDSVITLSLMLKPSYTHTAAAMICADMLPYAYGDSLLTESGLHNITFAAENGCDSTVMLGLTVRPTYRHRDTLTVCDNMLPYRYGDSLLSEAGVYTFGYTSMQGCDSVVTLGLAVNATYRHRDTLTVCDNMLPYSYGDSVLTEAGVYTIGFVSTTGCDSTVTLILTVNPTAEIVLYDTICQGTDYASYGFSLRNAQASDTLKQELATVHGCDSTVTLILTVKPSVETVVYDTICQGADYAGYGFTITNAQSNDTLKQELATVNGCDSTVTLILTVKPTVETVVYDTICQGADYASYGFSLRNAQVNDTLKQELATVHGCDSTVTLVRTIKPTVETVLYDTICQGADYASYGFSLRNAQASDTLKQTFVADNGYDSTVVLILTVKPIYNHTASIAVCDNMLPYTYGDTTLYAMGSHTIRYTAVSGCDSVLTLNLQHKPSYYQADAATICANMLPYAYGDSVLTEGGFHNITFAAENGCDSTILLALTVNATYRHSDARTVCDNMLPFSYGDSLLTATGVYTFGFSSMQGCDSVVTLGLTVNETYQHSDTLMLCDNMLPYRYGESDLTEAGEHTIGFSTVNGCDSTVTLSLTVNVTVETILYDTVCQGSDYAEYGVSLTNVQESGTYTQELSSLYGCDSIVTLHLTVQTVGIETIANGEEMAVVLYPNPADERVTLQVQALPNDAEVTIYDAQGRAVLSRTLKAGEEVLTLNIDSLAAGSYHIRIISNDKAVVRKLIVR